MQGESPLNMMRPRAQRRPRNGTKNGPTAAPRRRLWPVLLPLGVVVALAAGWSWLWYYAASVAGDTLANWMAREAAAGRIYSCGSQAITGFPFRIQAHCVTASAQINSNQPPFAVSAKDVTFAAQVYHPTLLVGDVTSPVTVSLPGRGSFVGNWTRAQMSLQGLPPEPESVAIVLDKPQLAQGDSPGTTVFAADNADVTSSIIGGSVNDHPVIETVVHFSGATAPSVHALAAAPLQGDVDVVLSGFKDLAPKPWAERFREMQAAGGGIEIKHIRLQRPDSAFIGTGTLSVNQNGKLDGLLRVAISGLGNIVPLLGLDRVIGRGIDQLAGGNTPAARGLGALDKILPGLGGAVRDSANASIADNLNKMGQPTEIDGKPAIVLPLRVADGSVYLAMVPLGDVPPLF
jgi:hypothetical protein